MPSLPWRSAGLQTTPAAALATGLEIGFAAGGLLVLYPLCVDCFETAFMWLHGQPSPTARVQKGIGKVLPPLGLLDILVATGHAIENVKPSRGDT